MHAVALNEKALIPIVPQEKKHTQRNPHYLTVLHLKMHHIGFVYNSTEFQKSK